MTPPEPDATYVVGAGSAGSVIASRVTEDASQQVVLLEAGPDYPDPASLPADLRDGTRNALTSHDWGYRYRTTTDGPIVPQPRGRVVGGSSAVNTCIALRGVPSDYDEWGALGLADWSWDQCLPAFRRLEHDLDIDNEWHGQDGPLPIRRHGAKELTAWQSAFLGACEELGYPTCADTNDPTTTGYGTHAMNLLHGERVSAAQAYLTPSVRARDNLSVQADTLVRRVVIRDRRVEGIEVERGGAIETLPARKVVLSLGAVGTPGILLRSGIGPRREVERLGVELVMDRASVGRRLLDHFGAVILLTPRTGTCDIHTPLIQTCLRYTSEGSETDNDVMVQPGSFLHLPGGAAPVFALMICIQKTRGCSTIQFPSADPHVGPRMEGQVLSDPYDRDRAIDALQIALCCARSRAMRGLGECVLPSEAVLSNAAALDEAIGPLSGSALHLSGTVPMGPEGDPDAAIDGRGRVRGIDGLWVCDASVFPTLPAANTNLTTLMVAERFGEWFRDGDNR